VYNRNAKLCVKLSDFLHNNTKKQEEGEENAREKNGEPKTYSRQPAVPQPQGSFPPPYTCKHSPQRRQRKTGQHPHGQTPEHTAAGQSLIFTAASGGTPGPRRYKKDAICRGYSQSNAHTAG